MPYTRVILCHQDADFKRHADSNAAMYGHSIHVPCHSVISTTIP